MKKEIEVNRGPLNYQWSLSPPGLDHRWWVDPTLAKPRLGLSSPLPKKYCVERSKLDTGSAGALARTVRTLNS